MNQALFLNIFIAGVLTALISEYRLSKFHTSNMKLITNRIIFRIVYISALIFTVDIFLVQFNSSTFFNNVDKNLLNILESIVLMLVYLFSERVYKKLDNSGEIYKAFHKSSQPQRQVFASELSAYGLEKVFFVSLIYLVVSFLLFIMITLLFGFISTIK
jgi:hypothetical protein